MTGVSGSEARVLLTLIRTTIFNSRAAAVTDRSARRKSIAAALLEEIGTHELIEKSGEIVSTSRINCAPENRKESKLGTDARHRDQSFRSHGTRS